jgi:hypothetical protein
LPPARDDPNRACVVAHDQPANASITLTRAAGSASNQGGANVTTFQGHRREQDADPGPGEGFDLVQTSP